MNTTERNQHWEKIYSTKQLSEVSWYQPIPETSLKLIEELQLPCDAAIIDVGGGDSFLTDNLLATGYENVSVLDISASAIQRAKARLGAQAVRVKWIVADAADFQPDRSYDLWHDRATFHFLTREEDVAYYVGTAADAVVPGGYLIVGTFSETGPKKCSGIDIRQYSEASLASLFSRHFETMKSFTNDHRTPFDTIQNFTFCVLRRRAAC